MPASSPSSAWIGLYLHDAERPEPTVAVRRAAAWVEHSMARCAMTGSDEFDFDSGLLTSGEELQARAERPTGGRAGRRAGALCSLQDQN